METRNYQKEIISMAQTTETKPRTPTDQPRMSFNSEIDASKTVITLSLLIDVVKAALEKIQENPDQVAETLYDWTENIHANRGNEEAWTGVDELMEGYPISDLTLRMLRGLNDQEIEAVISMVELLRNSHPDRFRAH